MSNVTRRLRSLVPQRLVTAGAVACAVLGAAPASAQTVPVPCYDREYLVERLTEGYKERVIGYGIAHGRMAEVWASEDGSFSFIINHPNGTSCIVAAGVHWENLESTPRNSARLSPLAPEPYSLPR